jgi:hypothetical protein
MIISPMKIYIYKNIATREKKPVKRNKTLLTEKNFHFRFDVKTANCFNVYPPETLKITVAHKTQAITLRSIAFSITNKIKMDQNIIVICSNTVNNEIIMLIKSR